MQQKYWSLFTLQPCLDSKFIYCRNEMPVSVDNFSFGVASNLFMVHAVVQSLQFSVIIWYDVKDVNGTLMLVGRVNGDHRLLRTVKLCDVIVVAVGYRLAPETKYPGAFGDFQDLILATGLAVSRESCR
ncbi:hypothetical protein SADUNF_Sadunf06G0029500 [Salix dunnii]|uniref:Alpha/beta hydrolase fold-3 domain-containing protein n=1 Tax=Salix dunnii TaxID=1413687 RepID=A0A835MWL5_9ROSI|nr:hypothetical protein SADUNF_Sadunf06G0029500 [Salix dunnii]